MTAPGSPSTTTLDDGRLVPIPGGRSLYAVTDSPDSPDGSHGSATATARSTVVFEAGMGASRHSWALVLPEIATRTRVIAYDRAGLGRSPADDRARTLDRATDDLIQLLRASGPGPFVLVGHSWGGPVVRSAAASAPELVAGLVLVDTTDELCDLFFTKAQVRQDRLTAKLLPLMARLGLLRMGIKQGTKELPPAVRECILAEDGGPGTAPAFQAELTDYAAGLRSLLDAPPPEPAVPMTVISGGVIPRFGAHKRRSLIEAHARRAAAAPQGRHVMAERSGHLVMFTEPELIVAEIDRVLDAAT